MPEITPCIALPLLVPLVKVETQYLHVGVEKAEISSITGVGQEPEEVGVVHKTHHLHLVK